MSFPQWVTPERRAHLAKLATVLFWAYDYDLFSGKLANPVIEEVIAAWKADDRARRSQLGKLEKRRLHAMPQIYKRGPFGTLEREQFLANRPQFEIVGIGVSPFTQHRIAQVVIPGLHRTVWVDLHGVKLSKNKLHKLARYKRGSVPKELVSQIEARVRQQVARFL
jgi:hypothetical protein